MISTLRNLYRRFIHSPALDRQIYKALDAGTNLYSWARGYYFPANYIRRWKLDILGGLYEKETVDLFKKIIKPGMRVVDVGAHIGFFTRLFSKLVGSAGAVYAIEADPENFGLLEKNTQRLANAKIYHIAASDRAGTIDFYHCQEKSGCHSTLPNVPLNFKIKKIFVPADDLDSLLAREGAGKIDVIKMDIEGGEVAALRGLQKTIAENPHIAIVTEFAPDWVSAAGITPLKFLQNLSALNFKIFAILPDKLIPITTDTDEDYKKILPKPNTSDSYNSFLNLYCVRQSIF